MLSLIITTSVLAATYVCEFPLEKIQATATVDHVGEDNAMPLVTSELFVDGKEIPATSATCFYQNSPGQKGFRCSHKWLSTTYELYPKFENSSLVKLTMVRWDPREPVKTFETEACELSSEK